MRILKIALLLTVSFHAHAASPNPRLVVVLSIDQFRSDLLTRFEEQFLPPVLKSGAPGGFRYFMEKGAYFVDAQTRHACNFTAPGHATMLSGALPYQHGIIGNAWYDVKTGKETYCVTDNEAKIVRDGAADPRSYGPASPRSLLVSTVGDELKNTTGGRAKVVGVSLKDRAATLMSGRRADLVIWFDFPTLKWISSDYYLPEGKLPEWLSEWNRSDYLSARVPARWTRLLPAEAYKLSTTPPPESIGRAAGIKATGDFGKTFPHPLPPGSQNFLVSPWGSAYTLDTAVLAARKMGLGADEVTDILNVSLSSHDLMGHTFGPMSEESQDSALREDRMLSDFLARLGKLVPGGLTNVVLVLTADHGVTSVLPGQASQFRLPGGHYWPSIVEAKASQALRSKFGFGEADKPIALVGDANLWFDPAVLKKKGVDATDAARVIASALREEPYLSAVYARADVLDGRIPPTPVAKKIAVSVHAERSGDVVYAARPGYVELPEGTVTGTQHETPSVQESMVPLIFVGSPFKPGKYGGEAYLNDLAPTLSLVLGIAPPTASAGRPLTRALRGFAD